MAINFFYLLNHFQHILIFRLNFQKNNYFNKISIKNY